MYTQQHIQQDCLAEVYKEMVEAVGIESMLKLYPLLRGQQINFPVRLYAKEKVSIKISQEYNGKNVHVLSREYGYSSRWVQKVIKEKQEMEEGSRF
ncbi:Mor transcription activator family protein [Listeria newyorkensis]|uniref:Mor transcription activator family protein n=1 Tax=Listeria newyorkensis TaxID=1497681 RepID=A0A841YXU4_9LIST|nr:Mor transcription activator family protein [Listeria newyorkensis]MBC1457899.1 Mor transcription activator family protein [Listeria newyorkensis]